STLAEGVGSPSCTREHGRRPIDTDETNARTCEGQRHAAGSTTELEHASICRRGQTPPERHIAAAERPRILPVVERRVFVPAFPTVSRSTRASSVGIRHRKPPF